MSATSPSSHAYATLLVASLLSRRSIVGSGGARRPDHSDDAVIERVLGGATAALAVACVAAGAGAGAADAVAPDERLDSIPDIPELPELLLVLPESSEQPDLPKPPLAWLKEQRGPRVAPALPPALSDLTSDLAEAPELREVDCGSSADSLVAYDRASVVRPDDVRTSWTHRRRSLPCGPPRQLPAVALCDLIERGEM